MPGRSACRAAGCRPAIPARSTRGTAPGPRCSGDRTASPPHPARVTGPMQTMPCSRRHRILSRGSSAPAYAGASRKRRMFLSFSLAPAHRGAGVADALVGQRRGLALPPARPGRRRYDPGGAGNPAEHDVDLDLSRPAHSRRPGAAGCLPRDRRSPDPWFPWCNTGPGISSLL